MKIRNIIPLLVFAVVSGCNVPGPDGPADSFGVDFSLPAGARTDGAILFIVDGMHADIFKELLDAGKLPAIKKYFVDRGLYIPHAATINPPITMACLTSIVTGCWPATHGLIAPKWFDRNQLIFRNYETLGHKNMLDEEYLAPTIYEQFPDRLTFSLFLQPHRGATKFFENRISAGPAMFFGMFELMDRIALWRFQEAMTLARKYNQFPAITTVYLLAVNFNAYRHGVSSENYKQAIIETDRQIGRVLGDLQRAGLLEKVVIALMADHGHHDTPNHPKLEEYIRNTLGVNMGYADGPDDAKSFEERLAVYDKYSAIPYGAGDRYEVMYLRKPIRRDGKFVGWEGWTTRPDASDVRNFPAAGDKFVDLPAEIVKRQEIDAVAWRIGKDRVALMNKGGQVEFARVDGGIAYKLIGGDDPLGWKGKVPADVLAGKPMPGRWWLTATLDTEFPDLPEGIVTYFDGRLAADLVAFPAPTWDVDGWRLAGHGGIRRSEMLLPIVMAGPGVPHCSLPTARIIDVTPTLLELLGKATPAGMDGRSFLNDARQTAASGPTIMKDRQSQPTSCSN